MAPKQPLELLLALAEPRVRRPSDHIAVLFVIDRSYSVPQDLMLTAGGDNLDQRWERVKTLIETSIARRGPGHRNDQAGVILFGKRLTGHGIPARASP